MSRGRAGSYSASVESAYSQFDFTNAVSIPRISDTIAVAAAAPAAAAAKAAFRHDGCIPAALQPATAAFRLHSDRCNAVAAAAPAAAVAAAGQRQPAWAGSAGLSSWVGAGWGPTGPDSDRVGPDSDRVGQAPAAAESA